MYSWEIKDFIQQRNNKLTKKEFYEVVNNVSNPQIKNVSAVLNNKFLIVTDDNFGFEVQIVNE